MPTTDTARRKRLARRRRKKLIRKITTAVVSCAIILLTVVAIAAIVNRDDADTNDIDNNFVSDEHGIVEGDDTVFNPENEIDEPEPPVSDPSVTPEQSPEVTPDPEPEVIPEPEPEPAVMTVELAESDIEKGILILVNRQYPYAFADDDNLIDMFSYKSSAYKFRDTGMMMRPVAAEALDKLLVDFYNRTNNNDVNIISTHRDLETQQRIYDSKLKYYGGDVATTEKWVAVPGASEHHTGLAVDLGIYTDDGESFDFRGEDEYSWINENCWKYGFIVRYDSAKTDITGIAYEPWHFRYLGAPHAEIISGTTLCYEEYISYIKAYPYDGDHMFFTSVTGEKYEIFYLRSAGAVTTFELPEGSEYFVSGNNVDGFIVTVKLGD